jgi:hypothetical protein
MWVQANHAKTGWRRDIDPGNGEAANGRNRECANLARSCVPSYANDPFLRMIDHSHELAEDVFVRVVDFLEFRVPEIAVAKCKLDVHLRFSGLAFRIVQLGK